MTNIKRSIIGISGIFVAVVLAVFAGAPAQAATVANHTSGGTVLVTPSAPTGVQPLVAIPNAVAPTISPSVGTSHVPPSTGYNCPYGDLCAVVWDPTTGSWKVFYLYNCARYYLYNWIGTGNYYDHQTPGTVSHFYGSGGGIVKTFTATSSPTNVSQDWTPVYSIRNC